MEGGGGNGGRGAGRLERRPLQLKLGGWAGGVVRDGAVRRQGLKSEGAWGSSGFCRNQSGGGRWSCPQGARQTYLAGSLSPLVKSGLS